MIKLRKNKIKLKKLLNLKKFRLVWKINFKIERMGKKLMLVEKNSKKLKKLDWLKMVESFKKIIWLKKMKIKKEK